jgi:hypothetical protein
MPSRVRLGDARPGRLETTSANSPSSPARVVAGMGSEKSVQKNQKPVDFSAGWRLIKKNKPGLNQTRIAEKIFVPCDILCQCVTWFLLRANSYPGKLRFRSKNKITN